MEYMESDRALIHLCKDGFIAQRQPPIHTIYLRPINQRTKYRASYWHNHLFNPAMPGRVEVLDLHHCRSICLPTKERENFAAMRE